MVSTSARSPLTPNPSLFSLWLIVDAFWVLQTQGQPYWVILWSSVRARTSLSAGPTSSTRSRLPSTLRLHPHFAPCPDRTIHMPSHPHCHSVQLPILRFTQGPVLTAVEKIRPLGNCSVVVLPYKTFCECSRTFPTTRIPMSSIDLNQAAFLSFLTAWFTLPIALLRGRRVPPRSPPLDVKRIVPSR